MIINKNKNKNKKQYKAAGRKGQMIRKIINDSKLNEYELFR